jgi:hypothetical protein
MIRPFCAPPAPFENNVINAWGTSLLNPLLKRCDVAPVWHLVANVPSNGNGSQIHRADAREKPQFLPQESQPITSPPLACFPNGLSSYLANFAWNFLNVLERPISDQSTGLSQHHDPSAWRLYTGPQDEGSTRILYLNIVKFELPTLACLLLALLH